MWQLRKINNNFEGGTRSDFVVVGHPEYNLGKVACAKGFNHAGNWDQTPIPTYPKKSVAKSRLMQSGSSQLIERLRVVEGPRPGYQERAVARREAAAEPSNSTSGMSFEEFTAALASPETLASCKPAHRIVSGAGNHLGGGASSRHFAGVNDELLTLAERFKRDPEGVKRDLLVTGAWKYHASKLEKEQRNQDKWARSCAAAPKFRHTCRLGIS